MNKTPAGIYLHIPFCKQACTYCDFHFSTSLKNKAAIVAAMCRELELRRDFLPADTEIQTIYLGGGTPSLLTESELGSLLEAVARQFSIAAAPEITLEANPDDLTGEKLNQLARAGINRLSIGVQSFEEADLRVMNRSHNAKQALASIEGARKAGIDNFSVDLIFGLPGQDLAAWEQHISRVLQLQVPHLSCYALTVEAKTALAYQVKTGAVLLPEDEAYESQFLRAHDLLEAAGYTHYELSNYCLPRRASRHNSAYWDQVPYLGIGPSAHSFDGKSRAWNIANNARYRKALLTDYASPIESQELLSARDRYNEYIMTGLRRKAGIDTQYIYANWSIEWEKEYGPLINRLLNENLLIREKTRYSLTPAGWLVSDAIIRECFRT